MSTSRSIFVTAPLTPLEIASGVPIGLDVDSPPISPVCAEDPRTSLERSVLEALVRPPCIVSFSGGRDSSAILALATRVARREGLAPPIPVTLRFPGSPAADEQEWQEHVIGHLELSDWTTLEIRDELDLVGPVATSVLRRHGLVWPPNTHVHQPILEQARGGSILTGIDGDGLFGSWRWQHLANGLGRRRPPELRDIVRVPAGFAPARIRARADRWRHHATLGWLQPGADAALRQAWAEDASREPARWDRYVRWYGSRRSLSMVLSSFRLLAADEDVHAVHPFADPRFLAALGTAGGFSGYRGRTDIMRVLFSDILPKEILERSSKGLLGDAMWHRHSQRLRRDFDGSGLDDGLIDREALRAEWSQPWPHAATSLLLQAIWLAENEVPSRASGARTTGDPCTTDPDPRTRSSGRTATRRVLRRFFQEG